MPEHLIDRLACAMHVLDQEVSHHLSRLPVHLIIQSDIEDLIMVDVLKLERNVVVQDV